MTTPNHYSLSDYAVGFDVTAYKVVDLKLMYAHTLGSNQGATSAKILTEPQSSLDCFFKQILIFKSI
jgi:hypothetical protein